MYKLSCFVLIFALTLGGASTPVKAQGFLSINNIGDSDTAGDTGMQNRQSNLTDYQAQQYYTPERDYGWADRAPTGESYTTGKGTINAGDYMGADLPPVFHGAIAEQSIAMKRIRPSQYDFGFNQGGQLPQKWNGYGFYNPAPVWQGNYNYPGGNYDMPSYLFSGGDGNDGLSNPFPF